MKNPDTGILITFEGIDGSGKSTQAREIHNALSLAGLKVRLSREPGATPLGEEIRKILLSDSVPVGNLAELLLFLADRAQHVQDVLRPSRSSGEILLVDRFTDATTAYQGYGMGHPLPLIETLHKTILQDIEPFRTFLLDIDPLAASERIRKKGRKEKPDRRTGSGILPESPKRLSGTRKTESAPILRPGCHPSPGRIDPIHSQRP